MKKFFLFAMVAMMSLVANAQILKANKDFGLHVSAMHNAPAKANSIEGTDLWGYYLGNFDTNNFVGLGTGSAGSFRVAIKVPGNGVLAGAKIRGINLPALGAMTNVTGWVATGTGNSTRIATKSVTVSSQGYKVVEFDEPIEIPATGLYAGYTFTSSDAYPIATVGEDTPGGLFLATSATGALEDYSAGGFGVSALQVFVEGMVLPDNGVTVSGVSCEAAAKGATGTAIVKVVSNGTNGANSIGYTLTVNGVETTGTANVSIASGLNKDGQFEVSFTAPSEIGAFPASIAINTVNGQPNELSTEPVEFTVNTVSRIVPRMTVIEEFTGTGCGYCPRGWVGMEAVKNNQSDKALVIAWHRYNSSDPMYVANYAGINFDGAPGCWVDRKVYPDPYYGESEEGIMECVNKFNLASATVDIVNLKARFDENNKNVSITSDTEFLTNTNGYTIAYVITADELSGTTTSWKQSNYYYQYTASQAGILESMPDLAKFCKNGEYGKSSVAITFNDAMIGSTYNSSGKSLVPAFQTGQVGDIETSEYTLAMPTKSALVNALNYDKIYVTAIVIDKNGQIANAARVRVLGAGEVEPGEDDGPVGTEINGVKISPITETTQLMGEAMSPNAKYVVGTNYATFAPALWNTETLKMKDFAEYEEGAFHAVNNSGIAVGDDGFFAIKADTDGNVTKLFYNEGEEVYNEEWDFYYSTGDAGSSAWAISEDGKVIAGCYYDSSYMTTPCIWNENNERIDLPVPSYDELGFYADGAQVRWMTPDAKVLLGFVHDNMSTWPACIWRQNNNGGYDFEFISSKFWEDDFGQGKQFMVFHPTGLSENGQYVALTVQGEYDGWDFTKTPPVTQPARLNLANKCLDIKVSEENVTTSGIANDGSMLYYTDNGDMFGRVASLWLGHTTTVVGLDETLASISEIAPIATNTPCSITADGKNIQGFAINEEVAIFSYVMSLDDVATTVQGIETQRMPNDRIYNINGQQVQNMNKRGLYIINGKKVVK